MKVIRTKKLPNNWENEGTSGRMQRCKLKDGEELYYQKQNSQGETEEKINKNTKGCRTRARVKKDFQVWRRFGAW